MLGGPAEASSKLQEVAPHLYDKTVHAAGTNARAISRLFRRCLAMNGAAPDPADDGSSPVVDLCDTYALRLGSWR